jgi:hypothetical protein
MVRKASARRPCRREPTRRRPPLWRLARLLRQATRLIRVLTLPVTVTAAAAVPDAAYAAAAPPTEPTVTSIDQVVDNIRLWLMGILFAYATLCLVVAFFRYTSGDPGEVERAKSGFRNAAIGYAGAILAPLLVTIFGTWVA